MASNRVLTLTREVAFSQTYDSNTQSAITIEESALAASELLEEYSKRRGECDEHRQRIYELGELAEDQDYEKVTKILREFVDYVKSEAIPATTPIYQKVVPAVNQRRIELSEREEKLGKMASIFSNLSLFLYLVGSVLAITGKVIDKSNN